MTHPRMHGLTTLPEGARVRVNDEMPIEGVFLWGNKRIPKIGEPVVVTMNALGSGTVVAYFVECGYLGVHVKLSKPPEWWKKQNAQFAKEYPNFPFKGTAGIFGTELELQKGE